MFCWKGGCLANHRFLTVGRASAAVAADHINFPSARTHSDAPRSPCRMREKKHLQFASGSN